MIINSNTKIATILKHNPHALEAIISLSSKFEKLRNPILRKLMAGKASIAMASKISGCEINSFYDKLKPLGFERDCSVTEVFEEHKVVPDFIHSLKKEQITELDVRPVLAAGTDPLHIILEKIKNLAAGHVLKIINTFEPVPLLKLLEKKGFDTYVEKINEELVNSYFHKKKESITMDEVPVNDSREDWDEAMQRFKNQMQEIDVRQLEMPGPMISILEALDKLPENKALFVFHKKIPVFLLPELSERKFEYRIHEFSEGEVHLLIFRKVND